VDHISKLGKEPLSQWGISREERDTDGDGDREDFTMLKVDTACPADQSGNSIIFV
jgi:hypothetical protein